MVKCNVLIMVKIYDREVLYTNGKKVHCHELRMKLQIQRKDYASLDSEQWLTDTIIETAEKVGLYFVRNVL